jgi:hypothetical protein
MMLSNCGRSNGSERLLSFTVVAMSEQQVPGLRYLQSRISEANESRGTAQVELEVRVAEIVFSGQESGLLFLVNSGEMTSTAGHRPRNMMSSPSLASDPYEEDGRPIQVVAFFVLCGGTSGLYVWRRVSESESRFSSQFWIDNNSIERKVI